MLAASIDHISMTFRDRYVFCMAPVNTDEDMVRYCSYWHVLSWRSPYLFLACYNFQILDAFVTFAQEYARGSNVIDYIKEFIFLIFYVFLIFTLIFRFYYPQKY
jgi:hypothetical protein